jgi:hypothetical protein
MKFARNLNDDVTHWPVTGSDGFGGFLYGAPVLLKGRWEEKTELFLNANNEEEASQAIIYLNDDVDVGDWLGYGDFVTGTPVTNPSSLDEAHRIRQRNRSTDLRSLVALRKVYL